MLQYTIENGTSGCCGGLGATVIPQGHCQNPELMLPHAGTPQAAKKAGRDTWCETRGGQYMCLPRTLCIAGWFKGLQRAVNAYIANKNGLAPIRIDARIGPETFSAVRAIAMANQMSEPASVDELTVNYAYWAKTIADLAGVPLDVSIDPKPAPGELPQFVDDETAKKAGLPSGKSWWSWGKWVILAGMLATAGGLGWSIYKKRQEEKGLLPEEA
jgi:hypothetical protein